MNIKIGSKIHNRFDIEVRDKITGDLKQKGQAENIILDRIYTRLCNFNSYFSYIHFGQGTGTLDPSRELLFDELGYKSAETEETIKDFPVSKWTRKIVLNPEEYVGKSITEVGISDTYSSTKSKSYINTHALIKDAEGNQLTIEKTDTDVVIIYATVFIELQNRSNHIRFDERSSNTLLTYLMGGSAPANTLSLGTYSGDTPYFIGMEMGTKALTRVSDLANKKVIYTVRLGIDEFNDIDIAEMGLMNVFRCNLKKSGIWNDYSLIDIQLGIGDGENKKFNLLDSDIRDLSIYIDRNSNKNFTLSNSYLNYPYTSLNNIVEMDPLNSDPLDAPYNFRTLNMYGITHLFKVNPEKINGLLLEFRGSSSSTGRWGIKVYGSYDNDEYELIGETSSYSATTYLLEINKPFEYLKFQGGGLGTNLRLIAIKAERGFIEFNTPPPEGAIITADYTVPYIPKTEDYVLDVTMEIQFGEGV